MRINTEYGWGEIVFLKTDPDQFPRMVTAIQVNPYGTLYGLAMETQVSWHYEIEISRDRDIVLTTSN